MERGGAGAGPQRRSVNGSFATGCGRRCGTNGMNSLSLLFTPSLYTPMAAPWPQVACRLNVGKPTSIRYYRYGGAHYGRLYHRVRRASGGPAPRLSESKETFWNARTHAPSDPPTHPPPFRQRAANFLDSRSPVTSKRTFYRASINHVVRKLSRTQFKFRASGHWYFHRYLAR
ncbi:hypothetical protein BC826DRAFT_612734 [Russula brevipes]|nr:hypothetical protein BC826DRAFT_612734 [Russula brevipes]